MLRGPSIASTEAIIERRYSHFDRLHTALKKAYPVQMRDIAFPKKILTGNFKAETIAQRSRAFEQFLTHVYSVSLLRVSIEFNRFFYESDLVQAYSNIHQGEYKTALPRLKTIVLLQQGLLGDTHIETAHTLCALVAVTSALEQDVVAQQYAETALLCFHKESVSEYLAPLLSLSIRLCWKLGKEKKDLESWQQLLHTQGVAVDTAPSLLEVIKKQYLNTL